MKDRDERSRGMEVLMTDVFVKIKPTEPFRLAKQRYHVEPGQSGRKRSSIQRRFTFVNVMFVNELSRRIVKRDSTRTCQKEDL
jgi:hypothetical protein